MIRYLLDSSALWRILRDAALRASWVEVVSLGVIGSCHPQRVEFRRSARTIDEYEQMSEMFDVLYPDATVPKSAWRWIESAQSPRRRRLRDRRTVPPRSAGTHHPRHAASGLISAQPAAPVRAVGGAVSRWISMSPLSPG